MSIFCPKSILLYVLFACMIGGCSSKQQEQSSSQQTKSLPKIDPYSAPLYPATQQAKARDFDVPLVEGGNFSLKNQQGKVVLLNIWATWCAPCHEETPDFVDLYNKYKEDGLVILGVSTDKQGESVVKPFMEKYDVNYPMVIDRGTIMEKYGPTMSIPTTYIIDKEGNLAYFAVGALTKKELEPRIKKLLDA